jgi:LPS-assembly protein
MVWVGLAPLSAAPTIAPGLGPALATGTSAPPLAPAGSVLPGSPTATPAPSANPATPAPTGQPPGSGPGRLNFTLHFAAEKGAGTATGSAATLDYKRDDYAVLTGNVDLHYQDIELHADHVEIDLTSKQAMAQGNVVIDQGPKRLTGNTGNFDLDAKTGRMLDATAYLAPDYYFSGAEIDKVGDETYTIIDGLFTSCEQDLPDWSFRIKRATVTLGGYAHIRGGTMKAKSLPLFYTPWLLWPAMNERAAGFLIPSIHYSSERGAALNLGYFQPLGESYDTTFHLEPFTSGSIGVGDEFRYHPTQGTTGDFLGYFIRDNFTNTDRWMVDYNHVTEDLPFGMRAVVHVEDYSDINYLRDFLRDYNLSTLRSFESRAFISGAWGPSLFTLLLNDNKTYENDGTAYIPEIDQKKLPEITYNLRSTQLWSSPLYFQVQSSADYLDLNRVDLYSGTYGRFDLFPQLTLPIKTFPWMSLSLTGGDRFTYYGARVLTDPVSEAETLVHQTLIRNLPLGSVELVGPSFSKIYDFNLFDYAKFKHIIQPRVTYTYQGDFKNIDEVPLFDDVDSQALSNSVRVALQNRVLAKGAEEDASSREVLFVELARNISFDKTQPLQNSPDGLRTSQEGPLEGTARVTTSDTTNVQTQLDYNTLLDHVSSVSFSGNKGFGGGNSLSATWFVTYLANQIQTTGTGTLVDTFAPVGNQIRLSGQWMAIKDKLAFQGAVSYDFTNHLFQQSDIAINYNSQCYGIRLEYNDFKTLAGPTLDNRDIRFTLTLKGLGPLIDINNRSSATSP